MSATTPQPLDLDALPPTVREAFLAIQAEVAGLRAQTERQDYLIAELRHALYGKRSEQLDPDERQLAFEDLETAVAEAETDVDALNARNADGTTRRPAAKRNLGHLPDHLPRIEQVIEPARRVCPCGCTDMVKIGEGEPLRRHWFKPNGERRTVGHHSRPLPGHRHGSPPLCLPPLRCWRLPSRDAALAD